MSHDQPPHDDDPKDGRAGLDADWAEAAEQRVLDAALALAPETGWNMRLVEKACARAGVRAGYARLLLPHGPRDLAALLSRRHDAAALKALSATDASALKVRERIKAAVEARIEAAVADEPALKRALAFLALPLNLGLAARLGWESADTLWRWAGDTATDENHYSKRAILAGILATTLAVRLARGREAASRHLDWRIGQVMSFEKWKAGLKPSAWMTDAAKRLGELRYGAAERMREHLEAAHRRHQAATGASPPPGAPEPPAG